MVEPMMEICFQNTCRMSVSVRRKVPWLILVFMWPIVSR